MICPVCLQDVKAYPNGVTPEHNDTIGKTCYMSGRKAFTWDERATREAVANRSGGICEYCHRHQAQEMHHRKSRGVGGEWSPANILHLCARCHRHFTFEARMDGYQLGVCLRRFEEPGEVPVTAYDGNTLWLTDDVAPPLNAGKERK